ncbi:MAG TPA: sodium-dependent bicarbonate transport family permease [Pirellulales bacterium]|nr:sodium-dependent bicarbonate transport family permease [Pirellulales bacterium]
MGLRKATKLRNIDAATVVGYYGSDSAGTFVTCVGVLTANNIAYAAYMPVMLAVMEIPGCLVALYLVSRLRRKGMDALGHMPDEVGYDPNARAADTGAAGGHGTEGGHGAQTKHEGKAGTAALLHEVFLNPGLFLLFGGILIGYVSELQRKPEPVAVIVFEKDGSAKKAITVNERASLDGQHDTAKNDREHKPDVEHEGDDQQRTDGGVEGHDDESMAFVAPLQKRKEIATHVRLKSSKKGAYEQLDMIFVDLFQGLLCLFLLEMGMTACKRLRDLKAGGVPFVMFGIIAPDAFATLGMIVAHTYSWALGEPLEQGTYVLFAVLCGAASYIAVPAVQRMAIPEASPTLPLAASLGLTFSYNVTIGIPMYIMISKIIITEFPIG